MTLQSQMVEAAKQICHAIIAVFNALMHGMQPILLHVYTIV